MLKSAGQKSRPNTPSSGKINKKDQADKDQQHWNKGLHETVFTSNNGQPPFGVSGGSDSGEFAAVESVGDVAYISGGVEPEELFLEIQGQKVAGYTQRDVVAWLHHCCKNGNPVVIKTVKSGSLTRDLRQYLNTRFQKGSLDHDLQNTIRDNVYLRTVPVTTRSPRPGEVSGVDYTFLTPEEFLALERSGNLLESGVYEGNHYGTPKPPRDPPVGTKQGSSGSSLTDSASATSPLLPGAHPSSEGKRRRNRSNVEALTGRSMEAEENNDPSTNVHNNSGQSELHTPSGSTTMLSQRPAMMDGAPRSGSPLGPLPPHWEKSFTEKGEIYFIDHMTGTSHWLDPRLTQFQKPLEECNDDELPYGWEKIYDPHYGTYYIDHENRRTQYENPVLQAKREKSIENNTLESSGNNTFPRHRKMADSRGAEAPPKRANKRPFFTRNPSELQGECIRTVLHKSPRGLGFTIVGGDDAEEEFLQIKSVVPHGPAWQDGKLQTGDVLVFVNSTCVLGFTHHDMVRMFQSISPGEAVQLEVCRGYPLPFDPNDPNTEIVTTVAVSSADNPLGSSEVDRDSSHMWENSNRPRSRNSSDESGTRSAKSLPDLSNPERVKQAPRPGSADLLSSENVDEETVNNSTREHHLVKPEYMTVNIMKGQNGFGFTIADSASGQKVKKILDRSRCKNLLEGDILTEINTINVRDMNHTEVVQVLNDCSKGLEAEITVQRGLLGSPGKKKKRIKDEQGSPRKLNFKDTLSGLYRSKTPTADLYSTQPKEVVPNRPKTPLVDTRTRTKTPTLVGENSVADGNRQDFSSDKSQFSSHSESAVHRSSRTTSPRGSPTHVHVPYSRHYHYQGTGSEYQPPGSPSKQRTYPGPHSPLSAVTDQLAQTSMHNSYERYLGHTEQPVYPSPGMYPHDHFSYPPPPAELQYRYPYTTEPQDQFYNYGHPAYYPYNGVDNSEAPSDGQNERKGANVDFPMQQYPAQLYYTHNSSFEQGYGYNGVNTYNLDYGIPPRQDSGYSTQSQNTAIQRGSHPPSSPAYFQSDSLRRQREIKESTSFEHEQPSPSSVTKVPRTHGHPDNISILDVYVTLYRQESGFGFRIVGGTEEGSQVSIGHIVPQGAADIDGRLRTGDEIFSVDNQDVTNASHHTVVQLMGQAAKNGMVTLGVRRRIHQQLSENRSVDYPYDVTVTRRENEGFGFVIISSVSKSGSTIGRIISGSPAERCEQLRVGDRILAVNHVDIGQMHHGDIVNLIKDSGYTVTLTVGPPQDDASSTASTSQRSNNGTMVTAQAFPAVLPSTDISSANTQSPDMYNTRPAPVRRASYPDTRIPLPQAESDNPEDEQYYAVELNRGTRGFGFSIRGGKEFHNMPLFVLRIADTGPAAKESKLKVGDQIIEINSRNTKDMTHSDAIELIKNGGATVRLLVKRGGKLPPQLESASHAGFQHMTATALTNQRPTSALAHLTPPGLPHPTPPGMTHSTPNGLVGPNAPPVRGYTQFSPPNGAVNGAPQVIGAVNGPISHSSPRVVAGDQYYWDQYQMTRPL